MCVFVEPLFKTDERVRKSDYYVRKSFLTNQDIEEVKITYIMKLKYQFESVIQCENKKKQDNKRLMLENPTEQQIKEFGLNSIDNKVSILCNEEFNGLKKSNMTLLLSIKGCQEQQSHTDYDPSDEKSYKSRILLVAIMDDTNIIVWNKQGYHRRIISIPKGSVFIGRGTLIHGGSPYDSNNVRLHYNIDYGCDCGNIEATRTYLIHWDYLLYFKNKTISGEKLAEYNKKRIMEYEVGKEERKEKMKILNDIKYSYLNK